MKRTIPLTLAAIIVAASLLAVAPGAASASRIVVREGGSRLIAVPASGGRPQLLARVAGETILGTSASASGRTVAYSSRSSERTTAGPAISDKIWVKHGGRRPRLVRTFVSVGRERGNNPVNAISLSADGRRLLVTVRSGKVLAMRADGSGVRPVYAPGFRFATGPHPNGSGAKFTPDGRKIVAAFEATTGEAEFACRIGIVPVAGGEVRFLRTGRLFGGISRFTAPTLSPDGSTVAFLEHLRDYERLVVMRLNGSRMHEVAASLRDDWSLSNPVFSPSGRALAFVAERVGGGGVTIGHSPSRVYTVRRSGARLRVVQTEKAHRLTRNPTWVR